MTTTAHANNISLPLYSCDFPPKTMKTSHLPFPSYCTLTLFLCVDNLILACITINYTYTWVVHACTNVHNNNDKGKGNLRKGNQYTYINCQIKEMNINNAYNYTTIVRVIIINFRSALLFCSTTGTYDDTIRSINHITSMSIIILEKCTLDCRPSNN